MFSWTGFEPICQTDVPLRGHTSYRLGGPARLCFTPRDESDLAALLRRCNDLEVSWRVLGGGSNLLVRDEGVTEAVIKLGGKSFGATDYCDGVLSVGSAVEMLALVKHAARMGWCGLERLAGIPGTVGGAVRMNAGGRYGCVAELVRDVTIVTPAGEIVTRTAGQLDFRYRKTELEGGIVTSVRFNLEPSDPAETHDRYLAIWNDKYATQPPLRMRSAGCVFKNPSGKSAGALIQQAGLKGHRLGGAEISERHANFIVAGDGASSSDVLGLIELARERVRGEFDVELALEVEIW
ncbi:MAG: UDP-N-acetylmuramate dehydrogenase [Planctomycetes bacterium]|nr:UDP-N-acetylmuramate dehydrogenase [Planctomycetota bacterium]